ncbi:MAG: RNB domain-containing ribonuclease, partial [Succinivibrio sp.]
MNEKAEVLQSTISRSVIKSDRRFTYEEAQSVLETGEGDCKEALLTMNRLAEQLRERRFADGAISFDRYEVKFDIDEKGKPIGTYIKVSKKANKLVEEMML